jgi:PadR family transcriptional regulator PadR
MSDELRLSAKALRVLRHFLDNLTAGQSGADITRATGVGAGTLYPLLAKLSAEGWLRSEWEAQTAQELGRPRKRLFQLTGVGQINARNALEGRPLVTAAGGN